MSQALVGGPRSAGAPLRRHHSERWLGGVAGGIARYTDVDPLYIRAAIVLLTVMGGAGIPVYIAAALLMPADGEQTSIAERLLKNKRGEWSKPAVVVAALLGITVFGANEDGFIGSLFPLLLVGGGVYLLANRSGGRAHVADAPPPPAGWSPPTAPTPHGAAAAQPDLGYQVPVTASPPPPIVTSGLGPELDTTPPPPTVPDIDEGEDPILAAARELDAELYDPSPTWQPYTYEPEPVVASPKRRRNPLVGLALSTLVIGGGLAVLWHAAGFPSIPASALAALGLLVVGGALVLSRPLGGARILIPVGVVLLLITAGSGGDADLNLDIDGVGGEFVRAPTVLVEEVTTYTFGGGEATIDLSGVNFTGQKTVVARMAGGEMTILVPDDIKVIANGGLVGGDLSVFDAASSGMTPSEQSTLNPDFEGPTLVVDAQMAGGELTISAVPRKTSAELAEIRSESPVAELDRREAELDVERDRLENELEAERDHIENELEAEQDRLEAERDSLLEETGS